MADYKIRKTIMNLKASSLQGPKPTQSKLHKMVVIHIRLIEQNIKEAIADNKTFIDYKIESDFDNIVGMTNSEVQTFVYSKIIEDLSVCEYDVFFRNIPDDYTFFIRWGSPMAKAEFENRKKIIQIASNKYKNKKKQIHMKKSNMMVKPKPNDNIREISRQMNQMSMSSQLPDYKHLFGSEEDENDGDEEEEEGEDWSSILESN
jgi:hypothetical protein